MIVISHLSMLLLLRLLLFAVLLLHSCHMILSFLKRSLVLLHLHVQQVALLLILQNHCLAFRPGILQSSLCPAMQMTLSRQEMWLCPTWGVFSTLEMCDMQY